MTTSPQPAKSNGEIIDLFENYIVAERRYSPLTVRNYMRDVRDFVAWGEAESGKFSLCEISANDVQAWIMSLSDAVVVKDGKRQPRLSAASINRAVASLRTLSKYMLREGFTQKDIFASISQLRTKRRLPKFVSEEVMVKVVERVLNDLSGEEYIQRRNALIILMLYSCGLRLAELINIRFGDFDSRYSSLRVMGKGSKLRVIPIIERVSREIKDYKERLFAENICTGQENFVFLSKKGECISRSDVQRSVARLLRECGVEGKASPHILRHTFATHLLNEGADLREIQELMGHSSLSATQVYTHSNIAQLQRVYSMAHPRSGGAVSEREREEIAAELQ